MSKFDNLFKDIISEFNINLISEATCKPDTMLNQADLNKKKIPNERKATVVVKSDGNTTGITYTVDSDNSAEMMADNIKANGGDAIIKASSGVTNEESNDTPVEVQSTISDKMPNEFIMPEFNKEKYEEYLNEGKALGIDAVTEYLQEHSAEVSQDFRFSDAPEEEYFIEYALVKYNNSEI